jgi:hypothetical protein
MPRLISKQLGNLRLQSSATKFPSRKDESAGGRSQRPPFILLSQQLVFTMSLEFTQDQIETIAKIFWGEPNKALSSKTELRFGTNGSRSVDLTKRLWYDHETEEGGDTFILIKKEINATDRGVFDWLETRGFKADDYKGNGHGNPASGMDAAIDDPFKNVTFKKTNKQFIIIKTWIYTDAAGSELFEVCRLENGVTGADGKPQKEYRQRRRDPSAPDGYINSVKGISQIPYRLPEIIDAIAKELRHGQTLRRSRNDPRQHARPWRPVSRRDLSVRPRGHCRCISPIGTN